MVKRYKNKKSSTPMLKHTAMHKLLRAELNDIADKHKWRELPFDFNTGKCSFTDETGAYRLDVYVTKMTVGIQKVRRDILWLKNQTLTSIERIMKNPYNY